MQSENNHKPLISVIMPAYNAEKFIARAIESVLKQSYKHLELIITDDASTDRTYDIIQNYNDPRIRLYREKTNTGSAYLPREMALNNSRGEYIINLDADDYIEAGYVEKMFHRVQESSADICCGWVIFVDHTGERMKKYHPIPGNEFDFSSVMDGREAFFYTLPAWNISLNGSIAKKEIWESALKRTKRPGKRGIHDDEIVSRYLLLCSNKAVFSKAQYYCTANNSSVTDIFNKRIFEYMEAEKELLSYLEKDFGFESDEFKAAEKNNYFAYLHTLNHFLDSLNSVKGGDINQYLRRLRIWHNNLAWEEIRKGTNSIQYIIDRHFYVSLIFRLLRKRDFEAVKLFARHAVGKVFRIITNNPYYKWYVLRRQREKEIRKTIYGKYSGENCSNREYPPYVISMIDGTVESGGLADRLKGIISTYAVCKEMGMEYRLFFKDPFDLSEYLEPNLYNWRIEDDDICRYVNECDFVILNATEDSDYQFRKQQAYLKNHLKHTSKQIQVFTNAGFSYALDYGTLFNELFKPSEKLDKAIETQKSLLGERYISISARFLNLLGDFNEPHGYWDPLSQEEKELLLDKVECAIVEIHKQFPDRRLLINSDSITFLNLYKNRTYCYVIPGNVTHIDAEQESREYGKYEKTFLDFMMIANAEKIFLIRDEKMFKSGYPYAASKLFSRPFEIINI